MTSAPRSPTARIDRDENGRTLINPARRINVCLVLDPEYGVSLVEIATRLPVWVVDSPSNRKICERMWSEQRVGGVVDLSSSGSITACKVADEADRETNLLETIPDIEVHYGAGDTRYEPLRIDPNHRYAHLPNDFGLEVIGLEISALVKSRLGDFGFCDFLPTASGFQTWIVRKHAVPLG